jgi:hypothetical protein
MTFSVLCLLLSEKKKGINSERLKIEVGYDIPYSNIPCFYSKEIGERIGFLSFSLE